MPIVTDRRDTRLVKADSAAEGIYTDGRHIALRNGLPADADTVVEAAEYVERNGGTIECGPLTVKHRERGTNDVRIENSNYGQCTNAAELRAAVEAARLLDDIGRLND